MRRLETALALGAVGVLAAGVLSVATSSPRTPSVPHALTTTTPAPSSAPAPAPTTAVASQAPGATPSAHRPATTQTRASTSPVRTYAWPSPTRAYAPLTIHSTLLPAAGSNQTPFVLRVRATDGDGQPELSHIDWGDGTFDEGLVQFWMCPMPPPPTSPPGPYRPSPADQTLVFPHAWRHAGTFTISVKIRSSGERCAASGAAFEQASQTLHVTVTDEASTSNGPAVPVVKPTSYSTAGTHASLGWTGDDSDGQLTGFIIDWGDGTSSDQFDVDASRCDDGKGAHYPHDAYQQQQSRFQQGWFYDDHAYAHSGSYLITITATSAGCDGYEVQEGHRQERHRV